MIAAEEKFRKRLVQVVYICLSAIYIYTAGFGTFSDMIQRCLLMTLCGAMVFLVKPIQFGRDKRQNAVTKALDWLLAAAFTVPGIYIMAVWKDRVFKTGPTPSMDIVMGSVLIVLLLAATYKASGWPLVITSVVFLAYAMLGPYLPAVIAHRGESWKRIVNFLYVTTEGIFGIPAGIGATYIVIFVIFGAFLEAFGAGQWFVDMAYAVTGRFRGGPAKTAVVSSALMGMISGSPAANVVTTGTFTIPLMKRTGYKPHEAGAVESVASTGGMFTPPVMGAAAFMMAEYLQITYLEVSASAIVPAALFYLSVMLVIDAIAVKSNLKGLPKSDLPNAGQIMRERGQLCIPIIFVIGAVMLGWSPMKAAFWAVVVVLVVAMVNKETRPTPRKILKALESGSRSVSNVIITCATAGIIVGVISMTGLGAKLSYTLISISGGNVYIAAVLSALITIILGCGMPPTPVYVILATVLVPPLTELGVVPIAAHMFIFIFSCIGALTPPVAITAYTAAAIAKADANKTGWTAFRFGLVAYIIPFIFLLSPAILMVGTPIEIALAAVTAVLGVFCLTGAVEGYIFMFWGPVPRVLLGVAALLMLKPGIATDLIGLGIIAAAVVLNLVLKQNKREGGQ